MNSEETPADPEKPDSTPAEPEKPETPAKTDDAPPEAVAAPKLTVFERGALRMLGIGGLVARVEQSEAALFTAHAELARLNAENVSLKGQLAAAPAKLKAASKVAENAVAKQVAAELTALGISEAAAPSQVTADGTPEALLEKFNALKGAEKTAFFRANKTALKAADAAKTVK